MTANQLKHAEIQEAIRHNKATEGLSKGSLDESVRHNKRSEGISQGVLDESRRHNLMAESMSMDQIMKNYTVGMSQASASQMNAQAALKQADIASMRQFEDARHNIQSEIISQKDINNQYEVAINKYNESVRHNKSDEAIRAAGLFTDAISKVPMLKIK